MKQALQSSWLGYIRLFALPLTVLGGILAALWIEYFLARELIANALLIAVIALGSFELVSSTISSLFHKKFALDYIALLAITVGMISQQYYVAGVIVLMLAGGNTLEKLAIRLAQKSLTALTDRIPDSISLFENGQIGSPVKINTVAIGQCIAIRTGEVIPLDGTLVSDEALIDESSLTGEPIPVEKIKHDAIRSGTVNLGNLLVVRVSKSEKESTYHKIVMMVQDAQAQKAPLIRLANKYSTIFTIVTFIIATGTYLLTHDLRSVLSVLVIATPCPLILATPIALLSGMNAAAKKQIIIKNLGAIESLSRVDTIVLDKTGTITLGQPEITQITIVDSNYSEDTVLSYAAAIERNSLHPVAKAISALAKKRGVPHLLAQHIVETIGKGISGTIDGKVYQLHKSNSGDGLTISLTFQNTPIAHIAFEDTPKPQASESLLRLIAHGLSLYLFTGDKASSTLQSMRRMKLDQIQVQSDMSPEDKKNGIARLRNEGKHIAMVGDGINDAPALALADVGMVYSSDEHTASTEAADIVFLGSDIEKIADTVMIGRYTISIAMQSILVGIGLSVIGMLFAAWGFIPPVVGAIIQELLDIGVIVNALRANK